ncbi:immunoglobulin-like domain-containing protein [Listeria booriae]|uniref:immunoglobulin-like domain-containing protein n=1 Tax=Listeria booriae TaxID=1552123 RepID=UPI001628F36D|nr:immunoglobulin-like domain-containing protein [Listeria booriae]MBC2103457.1 hypothetical protein [Listeria booriae]
MGTNKLIQKSLKLTAVGAIAFSVLAQPLSFVANASEVTKTENKLLTATVQSKELLKNNMLTPITATDTRAEQPFPDWQMALVTDPTLENISVVGADTKLSYDYTYYDVNGKSAAYFSYGSSISPTYRMSIMGENSDVWLLNIGGNGRGVERIAFYQDVPTAIGKVYTLNQIAPCTGGLSGYSVYASDTNSSTQLAYLSTHSKVSADKSTTFIATSSTTRITAILGAYLPDYYNTSIQSPSASIPNSVSLKENTDTTKIKTDIDALFLNDTPTSNAIKTTTDQAAIDALQAQIDILEASTTKTALQDELNLAQELLDARIAGGAEAKAATEGLFVDNDTTKGIKPSTDQAAIDAAQAKIDNVTDATVKAELQAELDKAQAELDTRTAEAQREAEAKAATEGLFVDNDTTKGIKPSTDQAAIDATQAKIDKVTDATVKAELQAELDKAQAELDARTAEAAAKAATEGLFVNNDTTKDIKPATNQAAIDAAQAKIDKVTDATVKAELQAALDKAQAALDSRTAEAQREAAAKAAINDLFIGNNPANNIKDTTTQAAIDAAQAKVNAVTDPAVKAELQAQVDKAQAQINTRNPINGTVAKYTVGDLNITGTYSGPATALSVDINGKRYYGGTIANGTFKFYVGDKNLKPSDVVTLNFYDANKQIQKSITVTVFEALKITIADYKIGDNYLTATYNYPEITKIGIVVDGTKYWGGDVKDGTAKFFAADKIKNANADVTMNFYDASNNLIASKKVVIATASAEISTANYTVGATNITGTFAGDIRKLAVSVNGTKYYGGSLTTNGTYKFYVLDKKIKATDTVIVYGYDANGGLLSQKTVTIAE